ncbi:MAG TPA: hypothetical protein VMU69_24270, partial [Bradyrhizobium sp.]|nr:hypothetical protein [Bradyrhizobium sp.]
KVESNARLMSALMVKLIIAVWQRKQLFLHGIALAWLQNSGNMDRCFCRNDVRCRTTINAARPNLAVNCNFLYRCHSGSAHPELSAAVKCRRSRHQ